MFIQTMLKVPFGIPVTCFIISGWSDGDQTINSVQDSLERRGLENSVGSLRLEE